MAPDPTTKYKIQFWFGVQDSYIEVWRELGVGWRRVYSVSADLSALESNFTDLIVIIKLAGTKYDMHWEVTLDRASILATVPQWEKLLT